MQDITQFQAKNLGPDTEEAIRKLIAESEGELVSMENPTTTLEDLFLSIVRDSDSRPGFVSHKEDAPEEDAEQQEETAAAE